VDRLGTEVKMQDCEPWWASIRPVEDPFAAPCGPGPGDDDDDDEDEAGGGNGGNIDPDDDEGYDEDEDDEDEEPLRCTVRVSARDVSLRRSIPWYDARVRRSARS